MLFDFIILFVRFEITFRKYYVSFIFIIIQISFEVILVSCCLQRQNFLSLLLHSEIHSLSFIIYKNQQALMLMKEMQRSDVYHIKEN